MERKWLAVGLIFLLVGTCSFRISGMRETNDGGWFLDSLPPMITNVTADPQIQKVNGSVNISCEVSDIIAIDEVRVTITYPDTTSHNESMHQAYYFNQSYSIPGLYRFSIWAKDTDGNTALSAGHTFRIMPEPFPALFTGLISDMNTTSGDIISFKAKLVFFMIRDPFKAGRVIPYEEIWVSPQYAGYLGRRSIIGMFQVIWTQYP